jgi:hypothetical protein
MKVQLLISFVFAGMSCFSQSPLSLEKDFWSGTAIHQNGKKISIDEAKKIVNNSEIATKLNDAQFNRTIGAVISYPCAFAFGYTIGLSTGNNDRVKPNWTVGGIGAAGMIIGLIFQGKGNKQLKEAVKTYNESIAKTTSTIQPEFLFIASENGIGISMRF